jgi:hypothetical protein
MPTPDTAMLAMANALRAPEPKRSRKEKEMRRLYHEVNQGTADTLRGYTRPSELLRETASSLKQLATHPIDSGKAIIQALRDPKARNAMIGSMVVPDPLQFAKILKGAKGLPTVKSDIVVPETLALPEEWLELELAKRGAPDHETGWFKGHDNLLRKELEPIKFDLSKIPARGELFDDEFWSHPTLRRRLAEKGHFGNEMPWVRMYDVDDLDFVAQYAPDNNQIDIGKMAKFRERPFKENAELLTHEFQHAIQAAGNVGTTGMGASPGGRTSFRRYLLNPGEVEARAAGARDYLLDPRYRDIVPFDWNTKKMVERLKWGGTTPKMEGPKEFLEDMEQWLSLTEPRR